jgi:hypothetical protein
VTWIFAAGCDDSTKAWGHPYAFVLRIPRDGMTLEFAKRLSYLWWEDFLSEGIDESAPPGFTPVPKPGTSVFNTFTECVR